MGQSLTVYQRNGTIRYRLDNYTQLCTVKSAEQKCVLLGEDTVTIKLTSATPLLFVVGDYIQVFGSHYTLNKFDEPIKTGEREFETSLVFEGLQYKLLAAQFRDTDAQGMNPSAEFSLVADIKLAAGVIINNINRVAAADNEVWELGECVTTEFKEYSFSRENCLEVLQRLCQDNKCEFCITPNGNRRYRLDIRQKVGSLFPAKFTYGKGGGIYQLKRRNLNNDDVISRLYVEGGTQNITSKYRNGAQRLRLSVNAESYIEDELAIKAFGIKEGSRIYDDIYPTRTGYVTSIVEGDVLSFIDAEMFDLNEKDEQGTKWLIEGTPAKVKFTGQSNLAGYTFDIHSYDHKTHKFKLVRYEDNRGFKYPSDTAEAYQIQQGDTYVLLDIVMPDDPYVVGAEAKLLEKAHADLAADCQPKVSYELELSSMSLERAYGSEVGITNIFQLGDLLHIKDPDINVDKAIRLTGFTRDCYSEPYKYKLTLSDTVEVSLIQNILEDIKDNEQSIIDLTTKTNVELLRMQWRTTQELLGMVFDADGYFDTTKIRPSSIETLMLSVGNRNGQFIMRDVYLTCNALVGNKPNANYFKIQSNGGILQHYAIEENIRTWQVVSESITLGSNGAMYLYAQCTKAGSTCRIILSQNRMQTEAGVYYYFLVGILSSVYNGYRELTTTYGNTRITGRSINCGRIESADKQTYFDLDNSEIGGRIVFTSNGKEKTLEELDAEALESKDFINNTLPGLIDGLQSQIDGQIEQFFYDYAPTLDNIPAVEWTTDEQKSEHLGDLFYDTSTGKIYRFVKVKNPEFPSIPLFRWQQLSDEEVAKALALANDALALAKEKRRVFVKTPYPPYDIGDLWVQGWSGDIMRCKTARASGLFTSSDWEKASKYTDDSGLNDFINGDYADDKTDILAQIDGKIETWFQTTDPSLEWITSDIKAKHVGDMWYHTTSKELKYYTSTFVWTKVEDSKAIAAYEAASKAQDTADGKRRVFVATPTVPYDVGDLWVDGKELRRCIMAKTSTQSYNVDDWVIAVYYDNTKTTIDGGIVTSGTIQVAGDNNSILAGITGNGTAASSIRFWAGASFENRATAPFRVLQDGSVVMTKATIEGLVKALSGIVGGWKIGETLTSKSQEIVLDGAGGRIIMGGSVLLDKLGIKMKNGDATTLHITPSSVGNYNQFYLKKSANFGFGNSQELQFEGIWSNKTSHPSFESFVKELSFMDDGSKITIDEFNLTFPLLPCVFSEKEYPITLKTLSPAIRVNLRRNGEIVQSYYAMTQVEVTSGTAVNIKGSGSTYIVPKNGQGFYSIEFVPLNDSFLLNASIPNQMSSASTTYFTATSYLEGSFDKSNNNRTLLGIDGISSIWENGGMLINKDAFVVMFGKFGIKIDDKSITKTSNGGMIWTGI